MAKQTFSGFEIVEYEYVVRRHDTMLHEVTCHSVAVIIGKAEHLACESAERIIAAHVLDYLYPGEVFLSHSLSGLVVDEFGYSYQDLVRGYGLVDAFFFKT